MERTFRFTSKTTKAECFNSSPFQADEPVRIQDNISSNLLTAGTASGSDPLLKMLKNQATMLPSSSRPERQVDAVICRSDSNDCPNHNGESGLLCIELRTK